MGIFIKIRYDCINAYIALFHNLTTQNDITKKTQLKVHNRNGNVSTMWMTTPFNVCSNESPLMTHSTPRTEGDSDVADIMMLMT